MNKQYQSYKNIRRLLHNLSSKSDPVSPDVSIKESTLFDNRTPRNF
jgi:hypothetical protein